jgi:DNA-directed RNA polymerase subunit F
MNEELKSRLIFIDTSAYESKNFQFDQHALKTLRNYLDKNFLHLLVTDITISEIKAHLYEKAKESKASIKRMQKEAMFLRNTPELSYHGIFERIEADEIYRIVEKKFEEFLNCEQIEVVDISKVNPSQIFSDYFKGAPPFGEGNKKSEFPDAFVLEAVRLTAEERAHSLYIISTDKDMASFVNRHPSLLHLESIDQLLDLVSRQEEKLAEPARFADSVFDALKDRIKELARDLMTDDSFYSDLTDGFEDEIVDVNVNSLEISEKYLIEASRDAATYEIHFSAEITAKYSFVNYEDSPWDPEDREYVFIVRNSSARKHMEKYSGYVTINYFDGIAANAEIDSIEFEASQFELNESGSEVISHQINDSGYDERDYEMD